MKKNPGRKMARANAKKAPETPEAATQKKAPANELSKLSVEQLKVMVYDWSKSMQMCQQNITVLEQELARRQQGATRAKV
jgi:hypothetical protein